MSGEHEAKTVQTVDGFLSLLMEQEKNWKNKSCINLKKIILRGKYLHCFGCHILFFLTKN